MKMTMLFLLTILTLFIVLSLTKFNVKAYSGDTGIFVGRKGSPNGSNLFDATNTFQYNGN